MFLKKIELNNFRNYSHLELNFSAQKTILVGKNAQGKTNLLEAIYYLASLSAPRAKNDNELIKMGESFTRLKALVNKYNTDISLEILINPPDKKVLKVNGLKKTKYSQFLGNLTVVSFSVNDLLLLRGTPSDRRKWIDDCISQLYPAYKERLNKYTKIRTQRNNFLKELKGNIYLSDYQQNMLSVWNEQLIISGSNLIHLRLKFLKEIQPIAFKKHFNITESAENLLLTYDSTVTEIFNAVENDILTPSEITEIFNKKLKEKEKEEIIRAQTLVGPHRDDISFFINKIDSKSYASQGQQRTIVLALKLAELDFIKEVIHDIPVLLLDDVLAELDENRQNYLFNSIDKDVQTIITTVDISCFKEEFLKDVEIFKISSGQLI